jgi:predicted transcriptional regulator
MQATFASVHPEDSAESAIQCLVEHKLSGAPVIDAEDRLHGIITEFQLLGVIYDPALKKVRVRELMTADVLTIEDTALLAVAANLLISNRIRLIPVVRGERVVGIISRGDLLEYFLKTGERLDKLFDNLKRNYPSWFEVSDSVPEGCTEIYSVLTQGGAASMPAVFD